MDKNNKENNIDCDYNSDYSETDYSDMPELISMYDLSLENSREESENSPLPLRRFSSEPNLILYSDDNYSNENINNNIGSVVNNNDDSDDENYLEPVKKKRRVSEPCIMVTNNNINTSINQNNEQYNDQLLEYNNHLLYETEHYLSKENRISILTDLCITYRNNDSECPVTFCMCKN
jgi:hypothetical protein